MHKNKCDLGYHAQTEWPVIRLLVGAKAWDMFMSLAATTKQLGVSFYQYIHAHICFISE
jgi:hypothetical protein